MSKRYATKAAGSNGSSVTVEAAPSLDALLAQHPRNLRALAASAKDFRLATEAEVRRILNEQPGNQLKAVRAGLERLADDKLISAREQSALNRACKIIFSAQRGQTPSEEAFAKVSAIYKEMLADEKGSPVALAIAGVAASTPVRAGFDDGQLSSGVGVFAAPNQNTSIGLVGGAIAGAVLGGAIFGFGGAALGALLGGAVGAIVGACS